jgi:hypothetical protein
MLESTIEAILETDRVTKKLFLGCFASNELPLKPKFPCCFIANTKPRAHRGEHWVAFHYSEKGICHFFDSYGLEPSNAFQNYLNETANSWFSNKKRIQGFSQYCGHYSLLFLLFKTRNKSLIFFNKFSSNYSRNDNIIKKLLNDF